MIGFDTVTSLAIVLLAALVHASFQLSVSVLTLLSGHALGRRTAHTRLLRLAGSFIGGAAVMTVLLLSASAYWLSSLLPDSTPPFIWALCCGAVIGVAISVWLFYYRREPGTSTWIPRGFARFLDDRAKVSRSTAETFGLGLTAVASELLFLFAPLTVSALVLIRLTPGYQLIGVLLYILISLLPLLVVGILIGGGHKLSHIQRWRENNKRFLQFAAGTSLLILGIYVYVNQIMFAGVAAAGGL